VRQREMIGIVTGLDDGPAPNRARELLAAPDAEPAVSGELLELATRAARHWGAPPGMMLRTDR
jgi:primosomal protein N'